MKMESVKKLKPDPVASLNWMDGQTTNLCLTLGLRNTIPSFSGKADLIWPMTAFALLLDLGLEKVVDSS